MPVREDVSFLSGADRCAAWLYRPDNEGPHPCVVMAHGFGGVREQRLPAYAERFAAARLAVLLFDYRHFGASEGEPRQLLSVPCQLEDWKAAVAFARARADIKGIALWGTSFAGGHVVQTAADVGGIRAVVSQVPFTDGLSALRAAGPLLSLKLTLSGLRDGLRGLRDKRPFLIPLVGPPGSWAAMAAPEAELGFRSITPAGATFRNAVAGRFALTLPLYRPYSKLAQTGCPVLVQAATGDATTPPEQAVKAAEKTPNAELRRFEGMGHFEVYTGEGFERVVSEQVEFLTRLLRPTTSARPSQPSAPPSRAG